MNSISFDKQTAGIVVQKMCIQYLYSLDFEATTPIKKNIKWKFSQHIEINELRFCWMQPSDWSIFKYMYKYKNAFIPVSCQKDIEKCSYFLYEFEFYITICINDTESCFYLTNFSCSVRNVLYGTKSSIIMPTTRMIHLIQDQYAESVCNVLYLLRLQRYEIK